MRMSFFLLCRNTGAAEAFSEFVATMQLQWHNSSVVCAIEAVLGLGGARRSQAEPGVGGARRGWNDRRDFFLVGGIFFGRRDFFFGRRDFFLEGGIFFTGGIFFW